MLAVVKKRRTKRALFKIKGEIPLWLVNRLKDEYGPDFFVLGAEDNEEYVDLFETDWYKKNDEEMAPGEAIKIYRENFGLTQEELGKKLGDFSRQNISAMENGRRGISKSIVKKLSKIFKVPADRFI